MRRDTNRLFLFLMGAGLLAVLVSASCAKNPAARKRAPVIELVGVAVGDTVTLQATRIVLVANLETIRDDKGSVLNYGDTCFARQQHALKVIATDGGGNLLVRYSRDPKRTDGRRPSECPDGTLELMTTREFVRLAEEAVEAPKQEQAKRKLIERLVDQSRMAQPQRQFNPLLNAD